MQLTREQYEIINATGDIIINAVAGSGKTTTIVEYARTRPKDSRILYLAFNKSVKLEAVQRFLDKGLGHVKVETAHSLAYKHIVFKSNFKVRTQSYKTHEIAQLIGLPPTGEKHAEYIIANHINKFIAYFCNSDKPRVQDLNYLDIVYDEAAKKFVSSFYHYIEEKTRLLLGRMNKAEIEITHDFYLKKFQLSNPQLPFDYILFDEGQDASAAMLDVFLKQKATKVIVGDTHQQIYSWRYAVNSLEKTNFKIYHLSTSFRFSQPIANLAMEILKWKTHVTEYKPLTIVGKGNNKKTPVKAILARTNLGLLLKAIEFVTENKKVKNIYFEGNINSYTYADDGASLYDVLSLYNDRRSSIKDALIKQMKDLEELEDYVKKTEDSQLGIMVEIVKEYGNEIPGIIKTIKEKHVENNEKHKAEIIFSTVHRCKGMEYEAIEIVNDFITEEKLERIKQRAKEGETINVTKILEEINLLYVAITRTKANLRIPETLLPKVFSETSEIFVIQTDPKEEHQVKNTTKTYKHPDKKFNGHKEKSFNVSEVRVQHKDAYRPWTPELDEELTRMYCERVGIKELAKYFGRTKGAISSRIKKLELEDLYR